jgi:hypothetical protein
MNRFQSSFEIEGPPLVIEDVPVDDSRVVYNKIIGTKIYTSSSWH